VISSLVNLQAQRTGEEHHRKLFEETSARVRAMALVHEKLYQSRDFSRINFRDYVEDLVSGLLESFDHGVSRIGLEIKVDDMEIGIDRAIPCAQIINELVTNSLKYAWADGRNGKLSIYFGKNGGDEHTLVVADNGTGIPAGFDPAASKTLGLQLVNGLVKQLRGSLEIDRSSGTKFIITFR
jgi:two-component sensor histidine kinase